MSTNKKNQEYLDKLRHSAAHLLAAAVLDIWPDTKHSIGPAIENGFYYDFEFSQPISEKDLPKIEKKMKQLVKNWSKFEKEEVSSKKAIEKFKNNPYKKELIEQFSQQEQTLTLYHSGKFTDLCRGGHIDSPVKDLKYFKLLSVAGAYWRGDENNTMLTRIYGTAFFSQPELDEYLEMLKKAKERDHKKLGKELDLFTFSELVGAGLPLWTPKGTQLRNTLDNFVWQLRQPKGYEQIEIPHITKKELYQISGHWDKFSDQLFRIKTREGHEFAMKPMNCPHHTQIYARRQWSYRELPQRYANTTMCYRDEQTGELNGLPRTRAFAQDDAHVFCRLIDIEKEINNIWDIVDAFYSAVQLPLSVELSFHDPKNRQAYLGEKNTWQQMEKILHEVAEKRKTPYSTEIGEAAFYGPKIDFIARDSLQRKWQVATIQLDMNMPERFDLTCVNEKGEKERIVMIHAAIMGSIERFLSILIEHFAGAFPLWLSPVQLAILSVGKEHGQFCQSLGQEFIDRGFRVEIDKASETVGNKIRKATKEKIPYMLVIGDKEINSKKLTVRVRGQKDLLEIDKQEFIKRLQKEISNKS